MIKPEYFQVICPAANLSLMNKFIALYEFSSHWDTNVFTREWSTADNGAFLVGSFPSNPEHQAMIQVWQQPVPSGNVIWAKYKTDRGPNPGMTAAELDQLRSAAIIAVERGIDNHLSDNGLTMDIPADIRGL